MGLSCEASARARALGARDRCIECRRCALAFFSTRRGCRWEGPATGDHRGGDLVGMMDGGSPGFGWFAVKWDGDEIGAGARGELSHSAMEAERASWMECNHAEDGGGGDVGMSGGEHSHLGKETERDDLAGRGTHGGEAVGAEADGNTGAGQGGIRKRGMIEVMVTAGTMDDMHAAMGETRGISRCEMVEVDGDETR